MNIKTRKSFCNKGFPLERRDPYYVLVYSFDASSNERFLDEDPRNEIQFPFYPFCCWQKSKRKKLFQRHLFTILMLRAVFGLKSQQPVPFRRNVSSQRGKREKINAWLFRLRREVLVAQERRFRRKIFLIFKYGKFFFFFFFFLRLINDHAVPRLVSARCGRARPSREKRCAELWQMQVWWIINDQQDPRRVPTSTSFGFLKLLSCRLKF